MSRENLIIPDFVLIIYNAATQKRTKHVKKNVQFGFILYVLKVLYNVSLKNQLIFPLKSLVIAERDIELP